MNESSILPIKVLSGGKETIQKRALDWLILCAKRFVCAQTIEEHYRQRDALTNAIQIYEGTHWINWDLK